MEEWQELWEIYLEDNIPNLQTALIENGAIGLLKGFTEWLGWYGFLVNNIPEVRSNYKKYKNKVEYDSNNPD